jgi:phenylpropionate dioxygenase-like ring-hydroxylating dioxygenase large terminal subunit
MLSREENELLTKVGPGTPMGALMRRYWAPVCYTHELPKPDCPPIRVKLMGESLVAFRDTDGRVGLLDEACPHRTASLFFGRNEECGLRCVYHGWKFDVDGNCVDMPSEPEGSNFKTKVRIKSYPCIERGGAVWTYMGPAELKPQFPDLEWTMVPPAHRHLTRHVQECNWLQAVEGGFDTSHLTFLHRGSVPQNRLTTRYEVVPTDFGFIGATGRDPKDGMVEWSVNVFLMPFHKIISFKPMGAHVWMPIDDEHTMNWSVDYAWARPLQDDEMVKSRSFEYIHTDNIPGTDRAKANRDNDYLIDRALQSSGASYTGIKGVGMQDCSIQESMGPIADRTIEHLGISDTLIIKVRKFLLQALKDHAEGKELPGLKPESWRVRSARFKIPETAAFEEMVDRYVRVRDFDQAVAAE